MSLSIRKFLEGIRIIPKAVTSIASAGEMEVVSNSVTATALLHFDGSGTSIVDELGNTVTVYGTASQTSGGVYLNCLETPSPGGFITVSIPSPIGTQDFTLECWLYPITGEEPYFDSIIGLRIPGSQRLDLYAGSTSTLSLYDGFSALPFNLAGTQTVNFDQWNHIAISRSSGDMRFYVNGVLSNEAPNSSSITANQLIVAKSADSNPATATRAKFDEVRLIVGSSLYSGASIVVPTPPLQQTSSGGECALNFHNGVSASSVITENSTATLSNKTLDSPLIIVNSVLIDSELQYLDGITSSIQGQLDSKQPTISGAASSITSSNLTASRALVSDSSGKVAVSTVTSTQLGYVSGVTSAIQTQLNAKAALASPSFSGTPLAPSPTDFDVYSSSTQITTVDHLMKTKREIVVNVSASGTQVLPSVLGAATIVLQGTLSSNVILTLPSTGITNLNSTIKFLVVNKVTMGANTLTISPPSGVSGTSVTLSANEIIQIYATCASSSPTTVNLAKLGTSSDTTTSIVLSGTTDLTGLTSINTGTIRSLKFEYTFYGLSGPSGTAEMGEFYAVWNGSNWTFSQSSGPSGIVATLKAPSSGIPNVNFSMTQTGVSTYKITATAVSSPPTNKLTYKYTIINQ